MTKVILLILIICIQLSLRAEDIKPVDAIASTGASPVVAESIVANPANSSEAKLTEEQIPLRINVSQKSSEESAKNSTRILLSGFIITMLLGAAYYLVRRYRLSNKINPSNMQIKVLSQHYLGPKKSLAIIRVSGESILIGVTDTNISMIKSLSLIDDEIPAEAPPQKFSETLQSNERKISASFDELEEEFSFSGVKDTVAKKLKSMRSIS